MIAAHGRRCEVMQSVLNCSPDLWLTDTLDQPARHYVCSHCCGESITVGDYTYFRPHCLLAQPDSMRNHMYCETNELVMLQLLKQIDPRHLVKHVTCVSKTGTPLLITFNAEKQVCSDLLVQGGASLHVFCIVKHMTMILIKHVSDKHIV